MVPERQNINTIVALIEDVDTDLPVETSVECVDYAEVTDKIL